MLIVNGSDLTQIACNIKYSDQFNNGASSLTFEYPVARSGLFPNGSTVAFRYGGANIFYGFLFTSSSDPKTVKCTAYDQLRYLKAQALLMRNQGETLTAFANRIFSHIGTRLSLGQIDNTAIGLPKWIFKDKTFLDMLYSSIRDNMYANGYYYALRDEFGAITLRDTYSLRLPLIIGNGSLATEYSYSISIDQDTANYVKVGHDNSSTGVRDTYIVENPKTIAKWGKLMLYKTVSGDVNDAQMMQLAANLLATKNRETETLSVECIGDTRVRAGCGVKVKLPSVGVDLWAIVTSAIHTFAGSEHKMKLELQYGRWSSWTS